MSSFNEQKKRRVDCAVGMGINSTPFPQGMMNDRERGGVIVCIDLMGGSICIRATKIHLKFGLHVVEIS